MWFSKKKLVVHRKKSEMFSFFVWHDSLYVYALLSLPIFLFSSAMKQSSLCFGVAQRSAVAVSSASAGTSASASAGACAGANTSASESESAVKMEEGESPESSSESACKPTTEQRTPTKKRKFPGYRHHKKQTKRFQPAWREGRDWLKHDASIGMWCDVCYVFRQHPSVAGKGRKTNSLANPSKEFRFRNVDKHASTCYHLEEERPWEEIPA